MSDIGNEAPRDFKELMQEEFGVETPVQKTEEKYLTIFLILNL